MANVAALMSRTALNTLFCRACRARISMPFPQHASDTARAPRRRSGWLRRLRRHALLSWRSKRGYCRPSSASSEGLAHWASLRSLARLIFGRTRALDFSDTGPHGAVQGKLIRMKVRRILQITWRGLVAVPLVASSWAPGWAHPISEALTAAGASPRTQSTQTHSSTPDSDGMPCHGMGASDDAAGNPPTMPAPTTTTDVDVSEGCADHCCPAAHCAPTACTSFTAAGIVTGVFNTPAMGNADAHATWHAPMPPRPPPAQQLRPPIF